MQRYMNGELVDMTDAEIAELEESRKPKVINVAEWRTTASLTRAQFCMALAGAGILPKGEAIDAAKGNWPATFAAALDPLSDEEEFSAQIEWATAQTVRRNHPLIAMLAEDDAANLSDAQVDALFGWQQ